MFELVLVIPMITALLLIILGAAIAVRGLPRRASRCVWRWLNES